MTVAPDGTAYAVDELTLAVFRIDPEGDASVFIRDGLLQDTLDIPDFLDDVGMATVEYVEGDPLVIAMADGSLTPVPVQHSEDAQKAKPVRATGLPHRPGCVLADGSITAGRRQP
ncbi:hypothetical protein ACFUVV_15815 [Streptomyces sp. NPDC057376]|uniref:hypothetical protein n=1 Tax=unclassified Streptomyces TaxID=2593676 RepID=UPI00093A07A8|nr:hypothetical protein [Streptomyces sp. CB02414]OKI84107.1 hypothetical protein AMK11_22500 [Streptomyces sp. CB02414]